MLDGPLSSSGVLSTVLAHPVVRWGFIVGTALPLFVGAVVPSSYLSVLTDLSVPVGPFEIRTWLHALGYATFGAVLATAVMRTDPHSGFSVAFGWVSAYGVLVEILHAFVPYRTFSTLDIAANVLGAFVGVVLVRILLSLVDRHRRDLRRRTYGR